MAKANSVMLDVNDKFPELELQLISGGTLRFPKDFDTGYAVLILYRGYW